MWYEIIPALVVVASGVYLPILGVEYLHKIIHSVPKIRMTHIALEHSLYLRDAWLCGNPLKAGLEGLNHIPDE